MDGKKSRIFTCKARDGYVSCTLCKGQVSLGPNEKNRSIGTFKKHIKNRHFTVWKELYSAENDTPISGKKRPLDDEELPTSANTKKARKALVQSTLPQTVEVNFLFVRLQPVNT